MRLYTSWRNRPMAVLGVIAVLAATLVLLATPDARAVDPPATDAIDQQQAQYTDVYNPSGAFIGAAANQVVAQSFTAGLTGALTRVSLRGHLQNSPAPGDMVVEIRNADAAGLPTGAPLATTTIPASSFTPFATAWFDATFTTRASVDAGSRYAIVVSSTQPSAGGIYYLSEVSVGNVYPGGGMSVNGTIYNADEDLTFKTYVSALESDGTLDPTFGSGGVVKTFIGASAGASAAVRQPDGKIVVVGGRANPHNAVVARYLANGALDTSFGSGGIREVDFGPGWYDTATAVALQGDGKIVVAGRTSPEPTGPGNSMVFRLTADGVPDGTFSGDSRLAINVGAASVTLTAGGTAGADDRAEAVVVQTDGKIVLAGTYDAGGQSAMYALRLNPAGGSLDTAFGAGGVRKHTVGASSETHDLVLQPDGRLVVVGFFSSGGQNDMTLVRLTTNGALDSSWDGDGTVTTAVGSSHDNAYAAALDPATGTIVVGGDSYDGGVPRFALVRYLSNGALDASFGSGGKVVAPVGSRGTIYAVARQSNGKIVAVGEALVGSTYDVAAARFSSAGALDTSFGGTGYVTTAIGGSNDHGRAVIVQPDNRIIAVGPYDYGGNAAIALVRYWRIATVANNPPSVAVGGVVDGASYEFGSAPQATCEVSDAEDGTLSFPASVSGSGALGSRTASCTYTDQGGAAASASATFIVVDTIGPTVATAGDVSAEATSPAGATVTYTPTATDLVDGPRDVTCSPSSGATFPLGTTSVTCDARDETGNLGTASFSVTVVDTTAPVVVVPAQITAEATSAAGTEVTYVTPEATDLVSGVVVPQCSPASGSVFALGTTTVTCTASDAAGNEAIPTTFPVVVQDESAPSVQVPAPITVEAAGPDGASASYGPVAAIDAVDGPLTAACTPVSESTFALGTTTVSCSVTDAAGNTGTGSFSVTVADTTAPTFDVDDIVAEATSPSGAEVSWPAMTAADIVDGTVPVVCDKDPGAFPLGTTIVSCDATDAHGNEASRTFTVTVVDTTPPVLPSFTDITEEAKSAAGAAVNYVVADASDVVGGAIQLQCAPGSGSTFPLGDTTVTCSATDSHGNSSSDTFEVHVVDTTVPALTVPANTVAAATSSGGAAVQYLPATAEDLVDGSLTPTCSPASGSTFPLGDTEVTCDAVDAHGNRASKSFIVRVQDEAAPQIDVPATQTVEATSAEGAVVDYGVVPADDNVDGAMVASCVPPPGSMFPLGDTTVACSATDAAGNTGTMPFTVSVEDTTPPTLTTSDNITVTASSAEGAAVMLSVPATGEAQPASDTVAVATDIVDGDIAPDCDAVSGQVFPPGTTTVTCTATDGEGNTASRSFTVTVVYEWSGIRPPINADGTSVFKAGSTVPVKFALAGASASVTDVTARLYYSNVSGAVVGTEAMALSTSSPDAGNVFRWDPDSGQYVFNLSTKALSPGTWQLRIDLGDGVSRTVGIGLRK